MGRAIGEMGTTGTTGVGNVAPAERAAEAEAVALTAIVRLALPQNHVDLHTSNGRRANDDCKTRNLRKSCRIDGLAPGQNGRGDHHIHLHDGRWIESIDSQADKDKECEKE